jgi:hypothetical protein
MKKSSAATATTTTTTTTTTSTDPSMIRLVKVFPNGRCILVNTSLIAIDNRILFENEIYSISVLSPILQLPQYGNNSMQLALFSCNHSTSTKSDEEVIRISMPYPFNKKIWYHSILFGLFHVELKSIVTLHISLFQNIVSTTWGSIVKTSSLKKAATATASTFAALTNKKKKKKPTANKKIKKTIIDTATLAEEVTIMTTPTSTNEKGKGPANDDDTTTSVSASASVSSSEGDLDEFDDIDEYVTVFEE